MGMCEYYGDSDDAEALGTIKRALDIGVTLLDKAADYGSGANERLVGRAVAGQRDEVVLATKFGIARDPDEANPHGFCGRPDYLKQACEASLRNLGVKHIDLYYQHRVDPDTPIEETMGAMAELEAGKVCYIGRGNLVFPCAANRCAEDGRRTRRRRLIARAGKAQPKSARVGRRPGVSRGRSRTRSTRPVIVRRETLPRPSRWVGDRFGRAPAATYRPRLTTAPPGQAGVCARSDGVLAGRPFGSSGARRARRSQPGEKHH
jgi:Aldo/keto reductase family